MLRVLSPRNTPSKGAGALAGDAGGQGPLAAAPPQPPPPRGPGRGPPHARAARPRPGRCGTPLPPRRPDAPPLGDLHLNRRAPWPRPLRDTLRGSGLPPARPPCPPRCLCPRALRTLPPELSATPAPASDWPRTRPTRASPPPRQPVASEKRAARCAPAHCLRARARAVRECVYVTGARGERWLETEGGDGGGVRGSGRGSGWRGGVRAGKRAEGRYPRRGLARRAPRERAGVLARVGACARDMAGCMVGVAGDGGPGGRPLAGVAGAACGSSPRRVRREG